MKKSTKAALLSGLVFPGVGQLYLRHWVPGGLLCSISACALYYIISVTLAIALDIAQKIESGAVPADINAIIILVSQQVSGIEQGSNIATLVLGACWVLGIGDAYWRGRAQDQLLAAAAPANRE